MITEILDAIVKILKTIKLKILSKWKSPCCECLTKGSVNDNSDSDSDKKEELPK